MSAETADRRRWLALYVLCGAMLMIVLDATIVNVALPTIKESLGFSQSDLTWVINAYLIPFGGLLLLAGRMGDLLGQRRIFMAGLAVFTVASLVCAAAENQAMLIGGRFFAGVGGAFASAVILGMIVTMFPEPREQAKAIGTYGFVASAGGSIGLLAGGALTQAISWHWIFLINLPIGIGVAYGALKLVEDKAGIGLKEGADVPGAALITGSLMIGTYAILGITDHGWTSAQTLLLGLLSASLFAGFLYRQSRIPNPLVKLSLFRNRNLSGANVIQGLLVAGMFGMFFLGALYLQQVLGYDALQVGLAFLPATVMMGALSLGFSEKLIMRFGPRTTLIPGVSLVGLGLLLFARTPVDGNYLTDVMPPMLLIGIGVGTSFPSLMTLAMSGASPEESGLASGVVNTSLQVGGAIGLAVLATLAAQRTSTLEDGGSAHLAALNSGFHLAYVVGAALIAVALVVAVTVLRQPDMAAMQAAHEQGEGGGEGEREGAGEPVYSDAI